MGRRRPLAPICLAAALTLAASERASAQPVDAPDPAPDTPLEPAPAKPVDAEAPALSSVPDSVALGPHEARGTESSPGVEPEDVALFVPRAVLFVPARIIGFISFPLREGLRAIEKHHVIERVEDIFLNDARTAGIVPLISVSTFFGAQLGVRAFHNDLGGHGEEGNLKASWGINQEQTYVASFKATRVGGTPLWLEAVSSYELHPSQRFYGFGSEGQWGGERPDLTASDLSPRTNNALTFYAHERFRQILTLGATLGNPGLELRLGARGRFKHHEFGPARGNDEEDRSLEFVYDTSRIPGYDNGADIADIEALVQLDARNQRGATSSGVYAEVFGGGSPIGQFNYGHFGGDVTAYFNLYHGDRVLVARLLFDAVVGDREELPFMEMPTLGGAYRLRGYPLNRFRDEKAMAGTLEYHYPIHDVLAGTIFVDAGEVSRDFDDLFTNPHIKVGGGGGLIVRSKDKVYLSLEVAGGDGVQVYVTTDPLSAFADRDAEL